MSLRVALITSPDYCEYIQKLKKDLSLPYELDFLTYTKSAALPNLFDSVQDKYDAFCTTGAAPKRIIKLTHPNLTKPIVAITESASEFYRILLKLLYEDRDCDFSQILFDNSLWLQDQKLTTAADYVSGFLEYNEKRRSDDVKALSLEELLDAENVIAERTEQLHAQGKLKLVVCRHSQAYSILKNNGIPCILAYPSPSNVYNTLRHLGDTLSYIRMEKNLPAVICVTSQELREADSDDVTFKSVDLQKCLLDYDQANASGMLIKRNGGGFELYTTQYIVRRLTQQLTRCTLRAHIMGQLGLQMEIGYGIGINLVDAREHAQQAVKKSQNNGQSYLVDEDGSVSGPIFSEDYRPVEDTRIQQIAKVSGLSTITIQRIGSAMELLGKKELTTHELAKALQVTVANANRFMNQLQATGYASVIAEQKAVARGRPARVYHIDF